MALDAHIQSLVEKHQALEGQLAELAASPSVNHTELTLLKRRKLQLKDQIARLQSDAA